MLREGRVEKDGIGVNETGRECSEGPYGMRSDTHRESGREG